MAAIKVIYETTFSTCIRRHHVYQKTSRVSRGMDASAREMLSCCHKFANVYDPFAVKVIKAGNTVGHLPKKLSSTCSFFIMKGGVILYKVTDPTRKYSGDLVQCGLVIPCVITLRGTKELIDRVNKLLAVSNKSIKPTSEHNSKNPGKKPVPVSSTTLDPNPKGIKLEQTDKDLSQASV